MTPEEEKRIFELEKTVSQHATALTVIMMEQSKMGIRLDGLESPPKILVWIRSFPSAVFSSMRGNSIAWLLGAILAIVLWNQWGHLPWPTPGPGPVPPGPTPGPTPIPDTGFRVLMVYESAEKSKYTAGQLAALDGQAVRDYLDTHCVKGPDGKTPERRIWDKDITREQAAADSKLWADALERTRGKPLPWLVISTGKTGYEGPLPEDALALLKKYGGD